MQAPETSALERISSESNTLRISESNTLRVSESPSGEQNLPSKPTALTDDASLEVSPGRRTLSLDGKTTPRNPEKPDTSESPPGRFRPDNRVSNGQDIVVRLPGDDPSRTHLMVASLDTQCNGLNLMSREAWGRLNEEGRGVLESASDTFVRNLGPHRLRVIGVVRELEWYFRNGVRTYTDDFHVIDMQDFDFLIGSETISRYGLLKPGPDLQHHMEIDAEDEGNCIYIEMNSPEH